MAKKYTLAKATLGVVIAGELIGSSFQIGKRENIPGFEKTKEDVFYEQALEDIKKGNITFENEELFSYLLKKYNITTKEELRNLEEVTIDTTLTNTNLSDLKYLQNVSSLTIKNNDIDLESIYYNENLKSLTIENAKVTNTALIPNGVETVNFSSVTVTDGYCIVPYFAKNVTYEDCLFNGLYLRNKNSNLLESLYFSGNGYLDLENLKDCENLKKITLEKCGNVKNANILVNLSHLEEVNLDDYAPCWLDLKTAESLNFNSQTNIIEEIKALEGIVAYITPSYGLTKEEKIKAIVDYIVDNLTEDRVPTELNNGRGLSVRHYYYKTQPIYNYVIEKDKMTNGANFNYIAKALFTQAGIDARIETNGENLWLNAGGRKIDIIQYSRSKKFKLFSDLIYTTFDESYEVKEIEPNRGPLSTYYEKEYKIEKRNLTQNQMADLAHILLSEILLLLYLLVKENNPLLIKKIKIKLRAVGKTLREEVKGLDDLIRENAFFELLEAFKANIALLEEEFKKEGNEIEAITIDGNLDNIKKLLPTVSTVFTNISVMVINELQKHGINYKKKPEETKLVLSVVEAIEKINHDEINQLEDRAEDKKYTLIGLIEDGLFKELESLLTRSKYVPSVKESPSSVSLTKGVKKRITKKSNQIKKEITKRSNQIKKEQQNFNESMKKILNRKPSIEKPLESLSTVTPTNFVASDSKTSFAKVMEIRDEAQKQNDSIQEDFASYVGQEKQKLKDLYDKNELIRILTENAKVDKKVIEFLIEHPTVAKRVFIEKETNLFRKQELIKEWIKEAGATIRPKEFLSVITPFEMVLGKTLLAQDKQLYMKKMKNTYSYQELTRRTLEVATSAHARKQLPSADVILSSNEWIKNVLLKETKEIANTEEVDERTENKGEPVASEQEEKAIEVIAAKENLNTGNDVIEMLEESIPDMEIDARDSKQMQDSLPGIPEEQRLERLEESTPLEEQAQPVRQASKRTKSSKPKAEKTGTDKKKPRTKKGKKGKKVAAKTGTQPKTKPERKSKDSKKVVKELQQRTQAAQITEPLTKLFYTKRFWATYNNVKWQKKVNAMGILKQLPSTILSVEEIMQRIQSLKEKMPVFPVTQSIADKQTRKFTSAFISTSTLPSFSTLEKIIKETISPQEERISTQTTDLVPVERLNEIKGTNDLDLSQAIIRTKEPDSNVDEDVLKATGATISSDFLIIYTDPIGNRKYALFSEFYRGFLTQAIHSAKAVRAASATPNFNDPQHLMHLHQEESKESIATLNARGIEVLPTIDLDESTNTEKQGWGHVRSAYSALMNDPVKNKMEKQKQPVGQTSTLEEIESLLRNWIDRQEGSQQKINEMKEQLSEVSKIIEQEDKMDELTDKYQEVSNQAELVLNNTEYQLHALSSLIDVIERLKGQEEGIVSEDMRKLTWGRKTNQQKTILEEGVIDYEALEEEHGVSFISPLFGATIDGGNYDDFDDREFAYEDTDDTPSQKASNALDSKQERKDGEEVKDVKHADIEVNAAMVEGQNALAAGVQEIMGAEENEQEFIKNLDENIKYLKRFMETPSEELNEYLEYDLEEEIKNLKDSLNQIEKLDIQSKPVLQIMKTEIETILKQYEDRTMTSKNIIQSHGPVGIGESQNAEHSGGIKEQNNQSMETALLSESESGANQQEESDSIDIEIPDPTYIEDRTAYIYLLMKKINESSDNSEVELTNEKLISSIKELRTILPNLEKAEEKLDPKVLAMKEMITSTIADYDDWLTLNPSLEESRENSSVREDEVDPNEKMRIGIENLLEYTEILMNVTEEKDHDPAYDEKLKTEMEKVYKILGTIENLQEKPNFKVQILKKEVIETITRYEKRLVKNSQEEKPISSTEEILQDLKYHINALNRAMQSVEEEKADPTYEYILKKHIEKAREFLDKLAEEKNSYSSEIQELKEELKCVLIRCEEKLASYNQQKPEGDNTPTKNEEEQVASEQEETATGEIIAEEEPSTKEVHGQEENQIPNLLDIESRIESIKSLMNILNGIRNNSLLGTTVKERLASEIEKVRGYLIAFARPENISSPEMQEIREKLENTLKIYEEAIVSNEQPDPQEGIALIENEREQAINGQEEDAIEETIVEEEPSPSAGENESTENQAADLLDLKNRSEHAKALLRLTEGNNNSSTYNDLLATRIEWIRGYLIDFAKPENITSTEMQELQEELKAILKEYDSRSELIIEQPQVTGPESKKDHISNDGSLPIEILEEQVRERQDEIRIPLLEGTVEEIEPPERLTQEEITVQEEQRREDLMEEARNNNSSASLLESLRERINRSLSNVSTSQREQSAPVGEQQRTEQPTEGAPKTEGAPRYNTTVQEKVLARLMGRNTVEMQEPTIATKREELEQQKDIIAEIIYRHSQGARLSKRM